MSQAKAEHGIEFDEYPNIAVSRRKGDWLYQIDNRFGVRVFRWPDHEKREQKVKGPDWDNLQETREEFEVRFENDFIQAVNLLRS